MFLSIITPTFNSQKNLSRCLSSVIDQNFDNYEQLIIDNSSTDKTISIAKEINNSRIKIISERDNGIYDAMNKGINFSKGKYLLFLNSDDELTDNFFFKKIGKILEKEKIDILYSNIEYSKNILNIKRKYIPGDIDNIGKLGYHLPHPGTIIKSNYLKGIGLFDLKYKISADFDFFIKASQNKKTLYYYYNNYTIKMYPGGASSGLKNIFAANIECYYSLKKNNIKYPFIFILIKLIRKFFQFL
tara:strand:+ start:1078 stop:1809 length:732 start_codon:yes stop_codon:yes gene_type:complete